MSHTPVTHLTIETSSKNASKWCPYWFVTCGVTYCCHTLHHWNELKKCFKMMSILICDIWCHILLSHTPPLKWAQKMLQNDAHINFVTCNVTYSCHIVYLYSKKHYQTAETYCQSIPILTSQVMLKSTGIHGSPLECLGISSIQPESVGECNILNIYGVGGTTLTLGHKSIKLPDLCQSLGERLCYMHCPLFAEWVFPTYSSNLDLDSTIPFFAIQIL